MSKVSHYTPHSSAEIVPGVWKMPLDGLYFVPYKQFSDHRGFYAEVTRIPEIEQVIATPFTIKQINHSRSATNVIRGFHAENWNKLVSIIHGEAFAAWVDVRPDSPTFGDAVTMQMSATAETPGSVFVSAGLANGFCVTAGPMDYLYQVDALYADRDPAGDVALSLFDEELAIPWPIDRGELIYSERDTQSMTLAAYREKIR